MTPRITPLPFTQVRFNDDFWQPRIRTNRAVTLPVEFRMCEETGRSRAFDWRPGQSQEPHWFWDSDMAKWIEAAAYTLAVERDPQVEAQIDAYVESMRRAQLPDGYVNSRFINVEPGKRWTNLRDAHEMYCAGHLIEAAVAYFQATGKPNLLDVMRRFADHIGATFGPRPGQKRGYCGHEEIELALVKLHRATGDRSYLDLARYFVDERGQGTSILHPGKPGSYEHYYDMEARARGLDPRDYWAKTYEYVQAHRPVREQTEVVGHAVRAMYLYSAMADLAGETGDAELRAACERLWDHVTLKRMYLTGGIGSAGANEGFTQDYDLPDETAYCETCAAVGLVFWAHRMFQLTGNGKYCDVMERALYNGALAGISLDGKGFFYANPLASNGGVARQAWWDCACCPPNIARLLASLTGYAYAVDDAAVWVNLYAAGTARGTVGGAPFALTCRTRYPWDGSVTLTIETAPGEFDLRLRIPDWCGRHAITVNGAEAGAGAIPERGYAVLRRQWQPGDTVELRLDMPVRFTRAHPRVRQMAGKAALERGPLVYCLESIDNPGVDLDVVSLPDSPDALDPVHDPDVLGGVTLLEGPALQPGPGAWSDRLYRADTPVPTPVRIRAIPYFAWSNRGDSAMRVWINA